MKKPKRLITGILGAALLPAGIAHAQYDVLMLLDSEDHSSAPGERYHADFIETASGGDFTFTFSYDLQTNVLDSETSLSQEQRDILHGFDLIVMPRRGAGSSSNFSSTDWNEIETPLLNMNPFTYRGGNWDWTGAGDTTSPDVTEMTVVDGASAIFTDVDTTGGTVEVLDEPRSIMRPLVAPEDLTGELVATMQYEDGDGNPQEVPWVMLWDGTETSFYDGGVQAPGGRRTMLLGAQLRGTDPISHPDETSWDNQFDRYYSEEGQQLILNSYYATVPEPSTYALWAGFGALGGVLLLRRLRRKS